LPQKRKQLTDADTIETATDRKRRLAINFNLNVECCVAYLQAQENAFPHPLVFHTYGLFCPEENLLCLGAGCIFSVCIGRNLIDWQH